MTFSMAGAGLVRDTGSHTIAGASIPGTISYRSLRMRYRDDVMTTPSSSTAGGAVTHSRGQPWNTISSRTWRRKRPASRDQSASTFGAGAVSASMRKPISNRLTWPRDRMRSTISCPI